MSELSNVDGTGNKNNELFCNDNRMKWMAEYKMRCYTSVIHLYVIYLLYIYHRCYKIIQLVFSRGRNKCTNDRNECTQCKRVKKMQKHEVLSWWLLQIVMAVHTVYNENVFHKYAYSIMSRSKYIWKMWL